MKCVSWNVNGLRACMTKGFPEFFASVDADIFALQETKMQGAMFTAEFDGYQKFFNDAEKKGYSGTAIFTKDAPLSVSRGIGIPAHDGEGRVLTLEYERFYIVNVYAPNSQRELARLGYRLEWEDVFRDYLVRLDAKKTVVACGDFNVAHQAADLKYAARNRGTNGFTDEERDKMTRLLSAGFTDAYRHLHPDAKGEYTWWSYLKTARANNSGWRIDYFLISERDKDKITEAGMRPDIYGSDHCPIFLELGI